MSNVNNVTAAKPGTGGAIRVAPYGTTLPTSATATLNAAFKTLGYITEDGFTNTNTIESAETKAWGGDTVFSGETAKPDKFKFKLLEYLNEDVLKFVYCDDNVDVDSNGAITIHANNIEHPAVTLVIDEIFKDGKKSRTVIANATVSELSEIAHKDGDPIAFETTVIAKPDSAHTVTVNGEAINDTHVTYIG